MDKNIYAAIAMALYEYQGNNVHDKEPGIITIKPRDRKSTRLNSSHQ